MVTERHTTCGDLRDRMGHVPRERLWEGGAAGAEGQWSPEGREEAAEAEAV